MHLFCKWLCYCWYSVRVSCTLEKQEDFLERRSNGCFKVAEHSFRVRLRVHKDSAKNKHAVYRAIIIINTRTIFAIFHYNWTQCTDGFSLLLQRYVRKRDDVKNLAILMFFFVLERTQLRRGPRESRILSGYYGLMRISRLRFKQSRIPMLITRLCFGLFCKFLGDF